ncbi:hypothetical protein U27_02384 [Candidatus Vecturithrix granuli]|uniref:Uncharacterized protein n=1 Tax=Vecturithrix granuli TaxID=1499967 RepID=A0A0S6WCK7_VECG1|nr:hypothetical protein U27_02384 [Candidatus Vecturithrix granuli]
MKGLGNMEPISIYYCFKFADETEEIFQFQLDPHTYELIANTPEQAVEWTRLDFHQCSHCPLSADAHPYCPPAFNLMNIVKRFRTLLPYQEVHLDVITNERMFSQDTKVQAAVGSMIGLVMATSGCPYMLYFRPMARFHLPLASTTETIYRSASMYLMAQYFLYKEGKKADLDLQGLAEIYENIHTVNAALAERLLAASQRDSSVDAVVQLDIYAMTFLGIPEEPLEEMRPFFESYFQPIIKKEM